MPPARATSARPATARATPTNGRIQSSGVVSARLDTTPATAAATASLLTGRPVKPLLGMTGEITLRGKVLPVGGIKEKILAAARFGLKTIILPKHNQADLDDVPTTVREQLTFILVDTVDEVLAAALEAADPALTAPAAALAISPASAPADGITTAA